MFYNVQNGEFKIGTFKNKLSPQKLGHFTDLIFSKDSSDILAFIIASSIDTLHCITYNTYMSGSDCGAVSAAGLIYEDHFHCCSCFFGSYISAGV